MHFWISEGHKNVTEMNLNIIKFANKLVPQIKQKNKAICDVVTME